VIKPIATYRISQGSPNYGPPAKSDPRRLFVIIEKIIRLQNMY